MVSEVENPENQEQLDTFSANFYTFLPFSVTGSVRPVPFRLVFDSSSDRFVQGVVSSIACVRRYDSSSDRFVQWLFCLVTPHRCTIKEDRTEPNGNARIRRIFFKS